MSISRERTTKELTPAASIRDMSAVDPGRIEIVIAASICVVAAAAGWWYIARTEGMYGPANPGHVSLAHVKFQNDCAECHDNDGKGGFRAAVYDSGDSLKCHPAAGHAPTELLGVHSRAHHGLAVMVKDPSGGMRSANCVACHTSNTKATRPWRRKPTRNASPVIKTSTQRSIPVTRLPVALSVTEFNGKGPSLFWPPTFW